MADADLRLAVEKHYKSPALAGKGGFWVKGHGFITTARARKITGIKGKTRNPRFYLHLVVGGKSEW